MSSRPASPRSSSSRPEGAEAVEGGELAADLALDRSFDPAADEGAASTEGLPSPGRYIREQRKRRGMSVEQLAVATKIPRTSVILLEEDRFDELPGPVFVKGFLRCSARALGLDADAVMELLYERERAQLQLRRRDRPTPPTRPSVSDVPMAGTRQASSRAKASAANAPAEGVAPRMPPRVRKQAPQRSPSILRALLTRMPSVSVLLWIVIAILVAMVMMAAFNLVGPGPSAAS